MCSLEVREVRQKLTSLHGRLPIDRSVLNQYSIRRDTQCAPDVISRTVILHVKFIYKTQIIVSSFLTYMYICITCHVPREIGLGWLKGGKVLDFLMYGKCTCRKYIARTGDKHKNNLSKSESILEI